MADNRKLAQGLMMMTPAMREDLAGREQDIQRGKTVELLRRAGKEMYENPIVNTAIGFTPILGDIQAAGETMAALNRGAPWQETAGYAAGMLPFVPMIGKTVWHGSPHTFDKFDLSKIGTGEGAQAYGHGLYFADAPEVAKQYRDELSRGWKQSYEYKGKPVEKLYEDAVNKGNYGDAMLWEQVQLHGTRDSIKNTLLEEMQGGSNQAKQALKTLESLPDNLFAQPTGSLYKVDLPDEQIAKMLDWDKPLSEQPESVRNILSGIVEQKRAEYPNLNADPTGNIIYQMIGGNLGTTAQKQASDFLNQSGIPGIQYLDQASRGAGEGTRNYVVFSDEIPKILERNGTPLGNAVRNFEPTQTLESLNPTGTVFTGYDPTQRATMPLGKNLGTLDKTMGINPGEMVTIYRGVPSDVSQISPGDFITTNERLAKDYAGSGKVISQKVPARTVLDDLTEPLGEEYIYRP